MRFVAGFLLALGLSACALFATRTPYVVFFQERSAVLDSAAKDLVAQAAIKANAAPAQQVKIIGFADRFGSPQADLQLSRQRADAVAAQLVADGVGADRLTPEAHGSALGSNPGVESRRVEIVIDP